MSSVDAEYEAPLKKDKIPVLEIFGPTLQGEGNMIGAQTWFVRTAGCDYRCSKCDSMHAVDPQQYKGKVTYYSASELAAIVLYEMGHCEWVTISGGNPMLWDFAEFVREMHNAGKKVAVETQGSYYKSWAAFVDVLTVSPKGPGMGIGAAESLNHVKEFYSKLSEDRREGRPFTFKTVIKIPVFFEADLDFAEKFALEFLYDIYLSVGNDDVPANGSSGELDDHVRTGLLLGALEDICQAVYKRPTLARARILPQLHVLMYGNQQGV